MTTPPVITTAAALAMSTTLPPMPGRSDDERIWPDRFFCAPSFEAVLASWQARGWEPAAEFAGRRRPRWWGIQAVLGDGVYEAWAKQWDSWREALDALPDPGGSQGRDAYEATKPTATRVWLVGCEVW